MIETWDQQSLHRAAAHRIVSAQPQLGEQFPVHTLDGLLAAHRHITAQTSTTRLLVVIGRLDLASLITGTCRLARGLEPADAQSWRRAFTPTIFLAGKPHKLQARFSFDRVADDLSMAWSGPRATPATMGLRRLLKLFTAPAPPAPVHFRAMIADGASGRQRDIYLTVERVSLHDCLVNLTHLVAEATLDGFIAGGDQLHVHLTRDTGHLRMPAAAVRVGVDPAAGNRLRAYAALI